MRGLSRLSGPRGVAFSSVAGALAASVSKTSGRRCSFAADALQKIQVRPLFQRVDVARRRRSGGVGPKRVGTGFAPEGVVEGAIEIEGAIEVVVEVARSASNGEQDGSSQDRRQVGG